MVCRGSTKGRESESEFARRDLLSVVKGNAKNDCRLLKLILFPFPVAEAIFTAPASLPCFPLDPLPSTAAV